MHKRKISNIYDFSKPFVTTRKEQAYFNTNLLSVRRKMQIKAFLLTYDWWIEQ